MVQCVTGAATVEVVEKALGGTVNKYVAGLITQAGALAVGVRGKDGNMILARRLTPFTQILRTGG